MRFGWGEARPGYRNALNSLIERALKREEGAMVEAFRHCNQIPPSAFMQILTFVAALGIVP